MPLAILLPPLAVLLFAWVLKETPNREAAGRQLIPIAFEPVQLDEAPKSSFRIAGAWVLSSPDARFGGISALAVRPDGLLALSDSGRLIALPKPASGIGRALVRDLPAGPGPPVFRHNRDSEALLWDPAGRGWWAAFEYRDELWLYDRQFQRPLRAFALPAGWNPNAGIEAMVADGAEMLLFPEMGSTVIRVGPSPAIAAPVLGLDARIADAATLPDGRLILLERGVSFRGFANALVLLERDGRGYRVAARAPLPLGPLDNAEALAAEHLPDGGVRLWVMTDDNFQKPLWTLLLAFDFPPHTRRFE